MIDVKTQPLCTNTELDLGARGLGEVEKKGCTALPDKGEHSGLTPSNKYMCPTMEVVGGLGEQFYRYGSKGGEVAEKDQGVRRSSPPLMWAQMVSR